MITHVVHAQRLIPHAEGLLDEAEEGRLGVGDRAEMAEIDRLGASEGEVVGEQRRARAPAEVAQHREALLARAEVAERGARVVYVDGVALGERVEEQGVGEEVVRGDLEGEPLAAGIVREQVATVRGSVADRGARGHGNL